MAEYITLEGLKKLKEKLNNLIEQQRPEVIKRVQVAREMGDLSENAEYHAAKEEQRHIDSEIDKINRRLAVLKIIDPSSISKDAVRFGAYVTVKNNQGEEEDYRLVGVDEVDFNEEQGITNISVASPMGKAMIGKKTGEKFTVRAPIGNIDYSVLNIK
ncbi:MAG: transcription elongation factor GreA [Candidatus Cloacimonetes bacterium]|nr:transcription elongation factor GreA [Candidatus Cloacimonadota bacterium]